MLCCFAGRLINRFAINNISKNFDKNYSLKQMVTTIKNFQQKCRMKRFGV